MEDKIKFVATNMQSECPETDCFACPYFNHLTAYCSAADKIKDCEYCKNACTDQRLDEQNDLSYISIGSHENGFSAFICSSAASNPPVSIVVQMYRNDWKRNVDIVHYAPAYCPVCGRKIIENERFLKKLQEKNNDPQKL